MLSSALSCPTGWFDHEDGYWPHGDPCDGNYTHCTKDHANATLDLCAKRCSSSSDCLAFKVYATDAEKSCYIFHKSLDNFVPHSSCTACTKYALPTPPPIPPPTMGTTLMGDPVLLDSTKKIVPWIGNTSTDQFAMLAEIAWNFWINGSIPNDPSTGLPLYFFFGSYSPSTHTGKQWPATPASMVNYLAQTAIAVYAYTGELHPVTTLAVPLARYAIANGTTPRDCTWPSIPYASSDPGAHTFDGANSSRFGGHGQGDGVHRGSPRGPTAHFPASLPRIYTWPRFAPQAP
jgi:hypothetical protein